MKRRHVLTVIQNADIVDVGLGLSMEVVLIRDTQMRQQLEAAHITWFHSPIH